MEEQLRSETRNMANIFLGLILVRIYEYFLADFSIPTLSFISYVIGIIFIFIFNRKHCWALRDFGIQGVINSTRWEVIYPALIWLGALLVIIIPEYIICTLSGAQTPYFDFVCFNQHIDLILSKSDATILLSWTMIGAIVCTLRALFFEVYFRGLCFGVLRKKTNFYACNAIQSLLFAAWFMILPLKAFVYSEKKGQTLLLMLLFFIAQFLFAFRQGYVRLVCGTIWPCVLTTFLYNMFTFNLITTGIGGEEFSAYADYIRWILINLIALLATLSYCKAIKKKYPPEQEMPLIPVEEKISPAKKKKPAAKGSVKQNPKKKKPTGKPSANTKK